MAKTPNVKKQIQRKIICPKCGEELIPTRVVGRKGMVWICCASPDCDGRYRIRKGVKIED